VLHIERTNALIVVDYGVGNLGSILNILKKIGVSASLSKVPEDILVANKLILPGVGAFDNAMKKLRGMGYADALNHRVLVDKIPILGICLGMQLFSKQSEEGKDAGFGWLDAQTVRFRNEDIKCQLKIPHMGWNTVRICQKSPLFSNPDEARRFYFVHSFHVQCNNPNDVLACTHYGREFTSAVCHKNIIGVQFHPEKSHSFGLAFFQAFAAWRPAATLEL
jgi:glutamine amidotransferase